MNMMEMMKTHWMGLVLVVAAFLGGFLIRYFIGKMSERSAEKTAKKLLEKAQVEAEAKRKEARLEAKDEIYKARAEFEKEIKERRQEVISLEKRVLQKEENVEKRSESIDRKESDFRNREKNLKTLEDELKNKQKNLDVVIEEERQQLQKMSGLSREEARKLLLTKIEEEIKQDEAGMLRQSETRIHDEIEKKARTLMTDALQRCAVEHVQEITVTTVSLPNDDIKGKIIGREGRNIRAFEAATGVDLIVDDTPEAVVISGFDVIRREIARIALEQLIKDGRIHPARIEEVVAKVKKEVEESVRQSGEQAVYELGLTTVHPEIVKLLGRLKYRTSYGQNVLNHSKEVAWIMGLLAGELGFDVKLARRVGLLHDIGKAVSHEVEGSHAEVGGELLRKYRESEEVVQGVSGHHSENGSRTIWGTFTQVADAISAARPGARSDTVENYLQRLEKLEGIASGFKGVERSYAIQAGREIRVIVKPNEITDDTALLLSKDIAKKIQQELQYPGVVKVTVIRETRAIEFAR